ncbi:hypothetical protein KAOT1_17883 [Kordia algicida OT-1]|uniref:Cytochrome c domain-containing protein n=2 Tax=Kordia TaxID=221065 RepID=A9DTD4_9FLAO|nr:hypothetical protein KAOT1_17883 [Kordia algicida OT-1]
MLFYVNTQELEKLAAAKPVGVCGVVYPEWYNDPNDEKSIIGRDLFKAKCAACHKLDALSTGPALRAVNNRSLEEGKNIDSFFKVRKAAYLSILKSKERKCLISPKITDEDIQSILYYTN